MSEIFTPFPYRRNPHVERTRAHLDEWTHSVELVGRETARQRFAKADFGWFAAVVYPTADPEHLDLMADWFGWLFLVDDQLDDGDAGRDVDHVQSVVARLRAVLDDPETTAASAAPAPSASAAERALADLWQRTASAATPTWRRRFVGHLDDCLTTAATWEARNRLDGIVPDERTYIRNRRHTGAIYVCMDLIDIVERLDIPEHVCDSAQFGAALDAACNVVCWTNDVYSLEKERALGEVHNLVLVVEHHRGLDTDEALRQVCAAISAETNLFLTREHELLAAFADHADVLVPCLAGMRSWMRGNLDWSHRSRRYRTTAGDFTPDQYLEPTLLTTER